MRVVLLDPGILDRLDARASAERWRRALHAGGWFAEPEGPERAAFRALREDLAALEGLEGELVRARGPIPWMVGGVPRAAWWVVGGTFAVLTVVGEVTVGLGVVVGAAFTPVVLLPVVIGGLLFAGFQERARRAFLVVGEEERRARGEALRTRVGDLARRTVVAPVANGRVVSAPHLAWVTHRLRDLRVARRPVEPPERDALVAALEAERERMERAVATGEADALVCDVPALAARFRALAVPRDRSGEGTWLAAALEGEG